MGNTKDEGKEKLIAWIRDNCGHTGSHSDEHCLYCGMCPITEILKNAPINDEGPECHECPDEQTCPLSPGDPGCNPGHGYEQGAIDNAKPVRPDVEEMEELSHDIDNIGPGTRGLLRRAADYIKSLEKEKGDPAAHKPEPWPLPKKHPVEDLEIKARIAKLETRMAIIRHIHDRTIIAQDLDYEWEGTLDLCPMCLGSGKTIDTINALQPEVTCPKCNGKGRMGQGGPETLSEKARSSGPHGQRPEKEPVAPQPSGDDSPRDSGPAPINPRPIDGRKGTRTLAERPERAAQPDPTQGQPHRCDMCPDWYDCPDYERDRVTMTCPPKLGRPVMAVCICGHPWSSHRGATAFGICRECNCSTYHPKQAQPPQPASDPDCRICTTEGCVALGSSLLGPCDDYRPASEQPLCECGHPKKDHMQGGGPCGQCPCMYYRPAPAPASEQPCGDPNNEEYINNLERRLKQPREGGS